MKKLILFLVLGLMPMVALAGKATLSWVPPTQNTDNSPYIDPGGFKIYYNVEPNTNPLVINIPDTTNTKNTYVIDNLGNGTWWFRMTAYNNWGGESAPSPIVTKTIAESTPNPPTPIFVTDATPVYTILKKDNGFVAIKVGDVPLGTECDQTQTVNGYFVVPISAVTSWDGTVRPIVVVASCSAG